MRWALLLLTATLAGCISEEAPQLADEPKRLDLTISWTPEAPRAGDIVAFDVRVISPVSGDAIVKVVWQIGDDVVQENRPERVFLGPGTVPLVVQVTTKETGLNQATGEVVIRSAPGQEPEPSDPGEPEPTPPASEPAGNSTGEPEVPEETGPIATEPDWGEPTGKGIRPGVYMITDGSGCTTSFLFTDNWERLFLATAAHCVADGGQTDTNGCTAATNPLGIKSSIQLANGGTLSLPVAYSSWNTMQERKESNGGACDGNDFALLEIPAEHWSKAHPASLHFKAPTGLATSPTTDIWGYGASGLKQGIEPLFPKQGRHIQTANGGWSHLVYLASPGIPGDSGGHIMTKDGQALGVASTVILTPTPAANHYTDFAKAVAYAAHAGLDLQIVTWDDFNASLA